MTSTDAPYYFRKGNLDQVYMVTPSRRAGYKTISWVVDPASGTRNVSDLTDVVIDQYLAMGYWRKTAWNGDELFESYFASFLKGGG